MTSIPVDKRSKLSAVLRGVMQSCPACGRGRLLHRYLKPVEACAACGERYGHMRADDAPPWMTILIVGHIVVPSLLSVEQTYHPEAWVHFAIWPLLTVALTLALLPRCKGAVLGVLWANGMTGGETQ